MLSAMEKLLIGFSQTTMKGMLKPISPRPGTSLRSFTMLSPCQQPSVFRRRHPTKNKNNSFRFAVSGKKLAGSDHLTSHLPVNRICSVVSAQTKNVNEGITIPLLENGTERLVETCLISLVGPKFNLCRIRSTISARYLPSCLYWL